MEAGHRGHTEVGTASTYGVRHHISGIRWDKGKSWKVYKTHVFQCVNPSESELDFQVLDVNPMPKLKDGEAAKVDAKRCFVHVFQYLGCPKMRG